MIFMFLKESKQVVTKHQGGPQDSEALSQFWMPWMYKLPCEGTGLLDVSSTVWLWGSEQMPRKWGPSLLGKERDTSWHTCLVIQWTMMTAKFKVPGHFAQRNRRLAGYSCVLLQRVDNRSLFTLHINDWFIQYVRGVWGLHPSFFCWKDGKMKNKGANFSVGSAAFNITWEFFLHKFIHKKTWCPFGSFKFQPFTELRWTEDFKVRGLDSWLYKHNHSQESLMLNQWTGNIFQSSHKLESSSSGTVFSRQCEAIRVELGYFFPILLLYLGEPLTCSGPELSHLWNGKSFPVL